ncbi:lipopolysaccharide biosynthesis protein [Bradyrhizobium diazoefficiens]|nr:lipopolysaccharide biosynthesis protein [Bradyrhizobium diazoefficiens]MBR0777401.1 lipopolysaccharide biosynthesis protein [Bradyrhizobium diazoefficiens]
MTNLILRSSTLGLRFLLALYIAKFLGFEATGVYGLTVGITGLVPALIGWGLNYFVAREVVGRRPADAVPLVKDRLLVTTISLALLTLAAIVTAFAGGFEITRLHVIIAILVWLETYALDLHLPLIGLELSNQANMLVFIRSAVWIPPIVALGFLLPKFQTVEIILEAWIVADVCALGILFFIGRHWHIRKSLRRTIDFAWIRARLRRSWYIYLSDLGIVGFMYADRYIVSYFLGLTATGIYTFFWSLTNALQTLVATTVVQIALPALVKSFPLGDHSAWRHELRRQFAKTIGLSVGLAVMIFLFGEVLLRYLAMTSLAEHRGLFLLMLATSVLRSCSDLANVGITSTGRDRSYATINIFGVVLSIASCVLGVVVFGLVGIGIASLATAIVLLGIRLAFLAASVRATGPAAAT